MVSLQRVRARSVVASVVVAAQLLAAGPAADASMTNQAASGRDDAAPPVSAQRAAEIVRGAFPVLAGFGEAQAELRDDALLRRRIWQLWWTAPRRPPSAAARSARAELDAQTGEIASFQMSGEPDGVAGGGPAGPVSPAEAAERALAFIRRLQPREAGKVRRAARPLSGAFSFGGPLQTRYEFHWERLVNGIPVEFDGFSVTVDAASGQITSYRFRWSRDVEFPGADGLLAPADAMRALWSEGEPLLQYVPLDAEQPGAAAPGELRLVWTFNAHQPAVDARTGRLHVGRVPVPPKFLTAVPPPPATAPYRIRLSEPRAASEIPEERAKEAARSFLEAAGVTGLVVVGARPTALPGIEGEPRPAHLAVEWAEEGEGGRGRPRYSVLVHRATGAVNQFVDRDAEESAPPPAGDPARPRIPAARAQEVARDFVRRVAPELAGQWMEAPAADLPTNGPPLPRITASFIRLSGGVPVGRGPQVQEGVHVGVDAYTGRVTRMERRWHALEPVGPAGPVLPEAEVRRVFSQHRLELVYVIDRFPFAAAHPAGEPPARAALVYRFAQPPGGWFGMATPMLDVESGQVIDRTGRPVRGADELPARVRGHWAELALGLLWEQRLIAPAADFDPDAPVSLRDAARLLITAAGGPSNSGVPASPEPDWLARAVGAGILDDAPGEGLAAEAPVRRGEFVVMLVRALGLGRLARMPNAVEARFADAAELPPQTRNAAGIAQGLGILRGDPGGRFRAGDALSWAELAAMLVRAAPHFPRPR